MFCHYAVVLCFGCIFSYPLVNLLHVALGVICVLVSGLSLTLRFGDCQFPFLPPQSFQIPCRLVRPIQAMLARTFDPKKKPPNPLLLSSNWSLCSKKSYLFGYLNTYHWHNLMIKNIKETFYARPFKFKNFAQPTGYSHVWWWFFNWKDIY
jgi:hypothetical protein